MSIRQTARLAARSAALRSALAPMGAALDVDHEAGVVRGVAVMTAGPALGHGFECDLTTLQQVGEYIAAAGEDGVKVRFRHPQDAQGNPTDDTGTLIGRVRNARVEGQTLRGDLHLGSFAKCVPGHGDVWSYVLAVARDYPTGSGLSVVFDYEPEVVTDAGGQPVKVVARARGVAAVDFVGSPAANPRGLLSKPAAPQTNKNGRAGTAPAAIDRSPGVLLGIGPNPLTGGPIMDLMQLLQSLGLDPTATMPEQIDAFVNGLSPEQKASVEAAGWVPGWKPEAPAAMAEGEEEPPFLEGEDKEKKPDAAMGKGGRAAASAKPTMIRGASLDVVAMERKRVADVRSLAAVYPGLPADVVSKAISDGLEPQAARPVFLAALRENAAPVAGVRVGNDKGRTAMLASIPQAIMLRSGVAVKDPHEQAVKFKQMTVVDMAKAYFVHLGIPASEVMAMSRDRAAELLLNKYRFRDAYPRQAALAQSTGDFASILGDTINKTLRAAYEDAKPTWTQWARKTTNPDFKLITRAAISEVPDMQARNDGGEIKYVTLSDGKETYRLAEYVGGIKLTRRAIINDDLDAFGRIPQMQGNSAARKEDDLAYAVLTGNAAMADTGLLFNATAVTTTGGHANYTSSGTALSVAALQVAETKVMKQKGPKNAARLELRPKFLLVPVDIGATARQLIEGQYDPAKNNESHNPYYKRYQIIESTRLSDDSVTAWYLMTDYRDGQVDTVELCFLAGEDAPVAKQEVDWDTEDQKYAIRHTVAAAAIDFRGMYKNVGA